MPTWEKRLTEIRDTQTEIMRLAPYRDVGLVPNPAASSAAIAAAEERLGRTLPPSYRSFLARHDGWPRFFEGATLLGTANLGKRLYQDLLEAAFEAAETPVAEAQVASRRGQLAARLIPFGVDVQGTTLLAFDPGSSRADGELEVIAWINEIGVRCESFVGFLDLVHELTGAELDALRIQDAGFARSA